MSKAVFKQLDQVTIITTRNVQWLSAPPDQAADPHGVWTVVGMVKAELILSKDQTLLRIPYSDVKLVATYDPKSVLTRIRSARSYGKKENDEIDG